MRVLDTSSSGTVRTAVTMSRAPRVDAGYVPPCTATIVPLYVVKGDTVLLYAGYSVTRIIRTLLL